MNPVIRAFAVPVTGYHRTYTRDEDNGNAATIVETEFQTSGHFGHIAAKGLFPMEGARQSGGFGFQQDVEEPILVTHREADQVLSGVMADLLVYGGLRYVVTDVLDLSASPLAAMQHRTYTLERENPI